MNKLSTIILFTHSYPYEVAVEHTFLEREVEYLSLYFDRVVIVPQRLEGKKFTVPENVYVEERYALSYNTIFRKRIRNQLPDLFTLSFFKDLIKRPSLIFYPRFINNFIYFTIHTQNVRRWVLDYIQNENLETSRTIFYTYWLDHISLGIGLVKKKYPQLKLISRAHNYDLYEQRYTPSYIPGRYEILKSIDRLFLISEHGRNHMVNLYPGFTSKYELSGLGTNNTGFVTKCSKDGVFRIVSCSDMKSIKRVDLLWKGIYCASELKPNQVFEWHHFGDGQLFNQIRDMAQKEKKPNVKCYFHGYVPNEKVLSFYRDKHIDVFMNVSQYEGLPVSIMEAQSYSIPVIATAVGGTSEIVSNTNGILLSENPTPIEIGLAICDMLSDTNLLLEKKKASHRMWQDKCNADVNFQDFAKSLRSFVDQE